MKVGKTVISNCDVRKWVMFNIIYMDSLTFIDVKINSNQFKELVMNKNVYFKKSKVIIGTEIINDKSILDLKKIIRQNKERNRAEIIKEYIDINIYNWIEGVMNASNLLDCKVIQKRDEIINYINRKLK